MVNPVNVYDVRFFALRRSGHHAIINWLAYHFQVRPVFIEGVVPFKDPYIDIDSQLRCILMGDQYRKYNHRTLRQLRDRPKYLIMNFEEQPIAPDYIDDKFIGKSARVYNAVVLRDPFNWMASRYQVANSKLVLRPNSDAICLWKQYAREYLGMTNTLINKVSINYNQWFQSEVYRRSISDIFKLPFTDKGLEQVPDAGRGSSFDQRLFDGKAQQMDVLGRWRKFVGDPQFVSIFKDDELIWLTKQCFSETMVELQNILNVVLSPHPNTM